VLTRSQPAERCASIVGVHVILWRGGKVLLLHPKSAGQWRPGLVYVTDAGDPSIATYTAPPAADVPGLMAELVGWLNAPDEIPH
jgi:hypothetical protein